MEPYDIVMLIVLVGATLWGAWKGVAWQIASLGSLALSYFMALRFSQPLAPLFGVEAPWNRFLAMFALYVASSIFVWILFRWVASFIDRLRLREFDRQAGALFGAAKGLFLCVAITLFAVSLSARARERILNTHSGYYIAKLIDRADGVMPREIHDVLEPYLHPLQAHANAQVTADEPATTDEKPAVPAAIPGPKSF